MSTSDKNIATAALAEHEKLDKEIELLRLRMGAGFESSIENWFEHTIDHFRHFHTQLRTHIEMEEGGGFLDPVRQRRPTLTPQVEKLKSEHRSMISKCVEIESYLESCKPPKPEHVDAVRNQVQELLAVLHEHEVAENRLVQETFLHDLGAGD